MATLKELIAEHCKDMTSYSEIAAVLNAPTVIDNPQTEPYTVPDPPTLKDVLGIVSAAERLAIRKQLPGFIDDVRRAIDTADADYMGVLITDAVTDNAISAETAAALAELLQRTTTVTPSATIAGPSLASAAGLGIVTSAAVQAALN